MSRVVVFDLDGTLVDTAQDLLLAANALYQSMGYEPPLMFPQDAGTGMRGGRAMLRLGHKRLGIAWDHAQVGALYEQFSALYRQRISVHSALYPGALQAMRDLRAQGCKLALCTNKPIDLAELLLAGLNLTAEFDVIIGAGSLPQKKPHAAPVLAAIERSGGTPVNAVMIGDTITDYDAARAAGIPVVLVSFGPQRADLNKLTPEATIENFATLLPVIDQVMDSVSTSGKADGSDA